MSQTPDRPKIYHITHVDNLAAIMAQGELLSDRQMLAQGGPPTTIGMTTIKRRRLALPVVAIPEPRLATTCRSISVRGRACRPSAGSDNVVG